MKFVLSATVICTLLVSCGAKKNNDEGFEKTKSGFAYKIISASVPGDSLKYRDVVKIVLHQYIDDSLLATTMGKMPQYLEFNNELREFDYTELLSMMKVNDSAVCVFETKDIIKRADGKAPIPAYLEKGKQIKVYFRILAKFSSEAEAMYDQEKTQNSLIGYTGMDEKTGFSMAEKSFDSLIKAQPVAPVKLQQGVYVLLKQKGNGGKIQPGQEVALFYRGMLGNGKVFEEATAEKPFVIRAGMGELSKGLDAGIASLSIGDKATIFVPAALAYGAQRAGDYIPAFSNLVFEVETADPNAKRK
jgi:FKBP-type peptidyl-prolyl cis-trans isomerase FkpA